MSTSTLTAERQAAPSDRQPLVVDLDGSLVKTDTLVESLVAATAHPLKLLRALLALRRGKAALKAALAELAALDPALLPYDAELLEFLRAEQKAGRPLILATAADRRIAVAVAQHLDLFDAVLASDGVVNLSGPNESSPRSRRRFPAALVLLCRQRALRSRGVARGGGRDHGRCFAAPGARGGAPDAGRTLLPPQSVAG